VESQHCASCGVYRACIHCIFLGLSQTASVAVARFSIVPSCIHPSLDIRPSFPTCQLLTLFQHHVPRPVTCLVLHVERGDQLSSSDVLLCRQATWPACMHHLSAFWSLIRHPRDRCIKCRTCDACRSASCSGLLSPVLWTYLPPFPWLVSKLLALCQHNMPLLCDCPL
jgi:hypothetical protein